MQFMKNHSIILICSAMSIAMSVLSILAFILSIKGCSGQSRAASFLEFQQHIQVVGTLTGVGMAKLTHGLHIWSGPTTNKHLQNLYLTSYNHAQLPCTSSMLGDAVVLLN